jgi:transcription initiation factor TFIIF subunit alpha
MMDEKARKLRKEERFPWLWEDASGREIWEGKRVERNRVKMQLLQVCKDGTFRWYPAKKYYMFTKLPTWRVPNAEEANDRVRVMANGHHGLFAYLHKLVREGPAPSKPVIFCRECRAT